MELRNSPEKKFRFSKCATDKIFMQDLRVEANNQFETTCSVEGHKNVAAAVYNPGGK